MKYFKRLFRLLSALMILQLIACDTQNQDTLTSSPGSQAVDVAEKPIVETESLPVPPPTEMAVDVVVSGRISTLRHIDIIKVGKQIPATYSEGKIANTPGFDWWVSRHFALKSDLPEDKIRLYLELLEMSYPHYVEAFGAEPANSDRLRIAVVYASSRWDAKVAMLDDGFNRGVHETAGGETMFYNRAGYNFPSARAHHQRYIVIHETAHAFHMALGGTSEWHPTWYTEGLADSIAHHVYDPDRKQLTLMNFDRPVMDYVQNGLEQYAEDGKPDIVQINQGKSLRRGINFLLVHFMLDHPERAQRFRLYRDMLFQRQPAHAELTDVSLQALKEAFGDLDALNRHFAEYISTLKKTFDLVTGPWEQDGNAFWVRLYNTDKGVPRIDFALHPAAQPVYSPLLYDFPAPEDSILVGEIGRGIEHPSIGVEVAFIKEHLHRGFVGIGLGVERKSPPKQAKTQGTATGESNYDPDQDAFVRVLIEEGYTLIIDGRTLGMERSTYPLPEVIVNALEAQDHPQLGLVAGISADSLNITIRTYNEQGNTISYTRSVPVSIDIRNRLMHRPLSILANDANHKLTPYFDEGRKLNPYPVDVHRNAPSNLWRNPADQVLNRLFRARWRLGEEAPASLHNLYQVVLDATDQSPAVQQQAMEQFIKEKTTIAADIAAINDSAAAEALALLSGVNLRFEWGQPAEDGSRMLAVVVRNPDQTDLTGTLQLKSSVNAELQAYPVRVHPASQERYEYRVTKPDNLQLAPEFIAETQLQWEGQVFSLEQKTRGWPYPGAMLWITAPVRIEAGELRFQAQLNGPPSGDSKGKMIFEVQPAHIVDPARQEEEVTINPYETRLFDKRYPLRDGADTSNVAVRVTADITVSGEELLLKARSVLKQ